MSLFKKSSWPIRSPILYVYLCMNHLSWLNLLKALMFFLSSTVRFILSYRLERYELSNFEFLLLLDTWDSSSCSLCLRTFLMFLISWVRVSSSSSFSSMGSSSFSLLLLKYLFYSIPSSWNSVMLFCWNKRLKRFFGCKCFMPNSQSALMPSSFVFHFLSTMYMERAQSQYLIFGFFS